MNNSPSLVGMVSIFILWLALVLGCKGNAVVSNSQQSQNPKSQVQSSGPSSAMNYSGFKQRLDAGASCAELFEIRNSLDPKASVVERYRAVINVPSSVPEQQALKNVARQYKIPVEGLRKVVNKVQKSLFDNRWFGTPESEIRRASDWKGEIP